MSSSSPTLSTNPRRVPVTRIGSPGSGHGLSLKTNNMLRKGATFHSPTSPVSDIDAPFCPPQLARSQSNLDDVVDAHRRRVALTLDSIGKTLAGTHISSPKKNGINAVFLDNDSDCVPKGLLDHALGSSLAPAEQPRRVLQPRPVNRRLSNNHHASDSGLGSSIASLSGKKQQQQQQTGKSTAAATKRAAAPVQAKAVTRSAAAASSEKPAGLSARATNRIYEHTVKPLLAKPAYKAFHPILLECTTKINKRDIVCLRDLEKTILFLAPVSDDLRNDTGVWGNTYRFLCIKERTKVAKLYLDFCLESVRCLQTTVEYLSEREQTRPADLPYTAGYFIDLVDQIHHYAQQLADAKANEKAGSVDMDFHRYNLRSTATINPMHLTLANPDAPHSSSDEIKLHGGIAVNGRPAELVRISRDGRAVSIATGLPVELEEDMKDTIRIKRSASQELEDEEEIMRSMARRKKNAPPEEYAPKMCSVPGCTKEFKRPCDLTKHEKTHSRPWKCPLESCKYHEYGWPTEKERDRHMNDKHSDNPPMYECLFKPCTYKSKRDSNRKQHMEKTHGWTYVRTKTNGSSKTATAAGAAQVGASPSIKDGNLIQGSSSSVRGSLDASSTTLPTPQLVNLPTPVSARSPNVTTPNYDEFSAPLFSNIEFPTCAPGDILASDLLPAELDDLDFSPLPMDLNDASAYASPSNASSLDNNSAYQDIGQDMSMYEDIYSAPMQLPTPEPIFAPNYANKELLDQFMALQAPELCAPMVTPAQQQQMARLQMMHQQMQQQERQNQQNQQLAQNTLMPHISPLGEANAMLFTPDSILDDEGFVDYSDDATKKGTDFILFPNAEMATLPQTTIKHDPVFDTLFEEMTPSLAAGFSQPTSQIYTNMEW
ncbi:zinc finger transcription factor ace1 [Sporothrix schenckii 1099-18]|uniref:Zinc finger transcription factor ace1 n=1 Tax=Sporothrix schenckii 1099-18 TaxID=1397361 RepID=A0A0F2M6Y1_SPOSC|nr:zinc finger transcription factor ace1 [Sporothrix schenckii 1099-18]KJR84844.1 zinc finger transcription factor ace1 [Sporothrix schenckii 1099-18]